VLKPRKSRQDKITRSKPTFQLWQTGRSETNTHVLKLYSIILGFELYTTESCYYMISFMFCASKNIQATISKTESNKHKKTTTQ